MRGFEQSGGGGVAAWSGRTRIGQKCPVYSRGPSGSKSLGCLALVNEKVKYYCYYKPASDLVMGWWDGPRGQQSGKWRGAAPAPVW